MKAATLKLMMRGIKAKPTLALGRTKEQAQMLYDESCKSLGEGESKKRYVPRALNIILKKEKFSFDMVIEALRTIPSSEVTMAKLADCGEKEACIAGALISWILTLQRQKETKTAAKRAGTEACVRGGLLLNQVQCGRFFKSGHIR